MDAMTPLFALGLGALYRKTNKKIGSISTCAASFLCFFFYSTSKHRLFRVHCERRNFLFISNPGLINAFKFCNHVRKTQVTGVEEDQQGIAASNDAGSLSIRVQQLIWKPNSTCH